MLAKDIIKRVREIQIRTGRQVADVLAGQYVSVFKGQGIEFNEVRPYLPGDDIRTIDWNVTARFGEPFVKRYVEERQLTMMLLADVSASQDFGSATRSKREATAELCALLAFSATRNDDKVGLALFHGDIEQYIPARKGKKHALRVVREVLAHGDEPQDERARSPQKKKRLWRMPRFRRRTRIRTSREATSIRGAVEFLMSVMNRKAVCFVVSDFFDDDYLQALQTANRKHDVIAVLVSDPHEIVMPNVGLVQLTDAETGETRLHDLSDSKSAWAADLHERVSRLEEKFRSAKIDFIHIDAAGSIVDPLAKFFRMRERRQRR
ncbi:MAG: DUF58 domain-containing protein [Planctomycetales bacterium]|nr:DUF58 domain-containing protein [Planctomycetales bacterium]